ncbi:MAG: LuxR C-terminal-related transcriptional regulator [Chloroflexota bacterium]|nr:LuxR C-terminal-related transcriptional regulator [Chloroflexota bacterium]
MAIPLLETKLYAPARRRGVVPRSRLTEQLDLGAGSRLTLISAPAGFGKTTLLADWLAAAPAHQRSVAWLSLDPGDNEPKSFWSYVMAALQTAAPGVGQRTRLLLDAPETSLEVVLTALLNELGAVPEDSLLVLDDYHLIDAPEIQEQVAFLLDHLPPQVHVIVATRADPALPLARLRARGELLEIRAADLRFTAEEAAAYLNGSMGLDLTVRDVEALEGRTEGWIAALQLAALSLKGRSDVAEFIAGFAGDDRYIVDYLVEEVLRRQPERARRFLLETSILGRLTGPLCDAVTGRDGGKATLRELDRANLFLVPLDDQRRWYRYHHLFADVLQARLVDEQPGRVSELHGRASEWYEQNGQPSEAIRHALLAEDFERAADLVELAIPEMRRGRQEARLRRWLEALPRELFPSRPVLSVGYVGALMSTGEFGGIEALLRDAERWLHMPGEVAERPGVPATRMIVRDVPELRRLPGAIAMYRAALAQVHGDVEDMKVYARRALELVGEDDHLGRGAAAALLGLAYWADGDLDAASRSYADGMASLEQAGHLADVVGGVITLADIRIAQGRLDDAMRLYDRALQVSSSGGGPALRGAADVHVGLSDLFRERNDLEAASRHLLASRELGDENGMPRNPYRWRVAAARLRQAHGDLDGAVELLGEAERLYVGDFAPDVRPVAAVKARILVAQGKLSEASGWARERGLTAGEELQYIHEFEHATLARLLLAQGTRDGRETIGAAIDLAERLLAAAQGGGRNGGAIDILVVQALAHHAIGDPAAALTSLERAVEQAEPEGYVRIFVDEGLPMTALLKLAAKQRTASTYVRGLLAAAVTAHTGTKLDQQPLIEPLSERELEVLRLLGSELDGPEIARELTVSLNTVRTHTKSIYAKLGVNSRRAAVRRAAELHLLARPRDRRPTG